MPRRRHGHVGRLDVKSPVKTWTDAFLGRGPDTALDRHLESLRLHTSLRTMTETVGLMFRVARVAVTPPFGWVGEMLVETSRALWRVTVPMMFATLVYVLAFGSVLFGEIIYALGAADRVGPGIYVGLLRELGTWLTFMILAGVVGSALAGDLGARKVREELDALDVLGVDKMRTLVVPRVMAITLAGLILSLLVVFVSEAGLLLLNTVTLDLDLRTQIASVSLIMNQYDLIAAVIKHLILGFVIGIVACQKGLGARGGAEGVGRAVNETVVITFFAIWLINSVFNIGYLTIFPEALGIKG